MAMGSIKLHKRDTMLCIICGSFPKTRFLPAPQSHHKCPVKLLRGWTRHCLSSKNSCTTSFQTSCSLIIVSNPFPLCIALIWFCFLFLCNCSLVLLLLRQIYFSLASLRATFICCNSSQNRSSSPTTLLTCWTNINLAYDKISTSCQCFEGLHLLAAHGTLQ